MTGNDTHTSDEIDLSVFAAPFLAKWKLLLVVAVVMGAAGLLYARTLPRVYESTASIYVQSGSASLLRNLPIPIAPTGSSSGYLVTLLQSDALGKMTIDKLNLRRDRYFTASGPMTLIDALKALDRAVTVNENKNGAITLAVRAQDPKLAADIANTMLDGLGLLVVTGGKRKADFIEQRLEETTRDLADAEEEMSGFLTKNKVAGIEDQTRQLITELGDLDGKILDVDAELQGVKSELSNAGNLDSLVDQEVRKRALESSRDLLVQKEKQIRARLEGLPPIGVQYARIQRKIAVLTQTFQTLTEQYQLARITQKGEDGDYQIIDRAQPNPKKVAPSCAVMALGGAVVGVFAACVLVYLSDRMRAKKKVAPPPPAR